MTTDPTAQAFRPQGIREILRQAQVDSIFKLVPGLYLAALALIIAGDYFPDPFYPGGLAALLLFLLPVALWAALRLHYLAAAWLLVVGSSGVIFLLFLTGPFTAAANLLALSVGLAAFFISLPSAIATAISFTLMLFLMPMSPVDPATRASTVTSIWGVVVLIWLSQKSLIPWMERLRSDWERSSHLLEESRDYQLQLRQTMSDLADANMQLTRLNILASRYRHEAEEAKRAKEEFVANVSHELRTPLNMIIGFIEMITETPQLYSRRLPARLLADLTIVMRNSQHLSNLIDDVLDLSKADAGQINLVKEPVRLIELVDSAAVAVRPLFESKGLSLDIELPQELVVLCDRIRIRQVILNLLSNAGRFTEKGGVTVRGSVDKEDVIVWVSDTGPGISEEDLGKLFQPFQQLDSTIRRRHGGSGLGLAISKNLVELHDGKMWVESQPGQGSTFYFRLPAGGPSRVDDRGALRWQNPYSSYQEHARRRIAPVPRPLPRMVIVEPGDTLQHLVFRHLPNIEIVPVKNLDEAIDELMHTPSQGLIVNSPAVPQILQTLQTSGLPLEVPAIVCSIPGVHEAAGALGLADYLVKPVSRTGLLSAIQRISPHCQTVLVVDDEPEVQRLFNRMLASVEDGYRILQAENGLQALNVLRQEHPDVILLDLIMPDMDGYQFLAAKGIEPAWKDIPVIGVSAQDLAWGHIVAASFGVTAMGGISVAQLLDSIRAICRLDPVGEKEAGREP